MGFYTNGFARFPEKPPESGILPVWQPQGESTHEIARKLSIKYGVKTSHTGTLDPMAEGVVIILLGDVRLKKYEYAAWPKTYEFEIVFGISTDTYDGMGVFQRFNLGSPSEKQVKGVCREFIGSYSQKVPTYSAIKVRGKSLHTYAKNREHVSLPERYGYISDLILLSFNSINFCSLSQQVIVQIKKIVGDFRQDEIINQWEKGGPRFNPLLQTAKLRVKMTKGLYVRSLVQDICKKLNTLGIANNIVRVSSGDYNIENSIGMT